MFKNIAVAYDESPEAERALTAAIDIARALKVDLHTISVIEDLPPYTAYGLAADQSIMQVLNEDREKFYERMQEKARKRAAVEGVKAVTYLLDGEKVDAVVQFVEDHEIDLLVIGLHRRSPRVSRLWSTVFTLAQEVSCSVLGVH